MRNRLTALGIGVSCFALGLALASCGGSAAPSNAHGSGSYNTHSKLAALTSFYPEQINNTMPGLSDIQVLCDQANHNLLYETPTSNTGSSGIAVVPNGC